MGKERETESFNPLSDDEQLDLFNQMSAVLRRGGLRGIQLGKGEIENVYRMRATILQLNESVAWAQRSVAAYEKDKAELQSALSAATAENERLRGESAQKDRILQLKNEAIFNLKRRLWNVRKDARDYRKSKNIDDFLKAREGVHALEAILAEQDKKNAEIQSQLAAKDAMLAAATRFTYGRVTIRYEDDAKKWMVWKNGQSLTDGWFISHDEAYQAALAGGWLEPKNERGGG